MPSGHGVILSTPARNPATQHQVLIALQRCVSPPSQFHYSGWIESLSFMGDIICISLLMVKMVPYLEPDGYRKRSVAQATELLCLNGFLYYHNGS